MRYRGMCPPGSYRTYQPQPETMRCINEVQRYVFSRILSYFLTSAWNNEVQSWGTEVGVLQDLIIFPDLSLKQRGTSMRFRGMCPPAYSQCDYTMYWPRTPAGWPSPLRSVSPRTWLGTSSSVWFSCTWAAAWTSARRSRCVRSSGNKPAE